MHRGTPPLEHSAAGARVVERSHLRRGRAGVRSPDYHRRWTRYWNAFGLGLSARVVAAPKEEEIKAIGSVVESQQKKYADDRATAALIMTNGLAPPPDGIDAAELAAWTSAARVILNLHETITRS